MAEEMKMTPELQATMARILEFGQALLKRNDRLSELREDFSSVVKGYETSLAARRQATSEKNGLEERRRYLEMQVKQEINEETETETDAKDGHVKVKKKYTNAEQREAATIMRLNEHAEYVTVKSQINELTNVLLELDDQLSLLKVRLRVAEAEVEIEKLRTGERT